MPAFLINYDSSLAVVLEEATYTLARLEAMPLTAGLAAAFIAFSTDWKATNNHEIELRVALVKAAALISAADDALDLLVDASAQAVLLEVKNDRKAPLYLLYFGAKRPSELKRPVLGGQLETMRGWIPSLLASANPLLAQLGATLKVKVDVADAAVAAQQLAEQKNRDFRTIGERKALVDGINALRKATYGTLSEMPHAHPEEHLPASFAEPFFRHDSGKRTEKLTAAELTEKILEAQEQVSALQEQYAKLIAYEEAAAKAKSDADAEDAALAQAEKDAADALAKLAAMKAKKKS